MYSWCALMSYVLSSCVLYRVFSCVACWVSLHEALADTQSTTSEKRTKKIRDDFMHWIVLVHVSCII